MSDIRYCERCGAPLIPGSRSCDNCGMQQPLRQQQTDIRPPYHPGHSIPRVNRGQGQNQNYGQPQTVSQPGQRRNSRLTEPEDGGRRQRVQQPMSNRSQPQMVSQPGQRRNFRLAEPEDSSRRQRVQQSASNSSQSQSVSQPGQRRNPRLTEPEDGDRRQRAQQPMPNCSQHTQQPMLNQNPVRPQQNPRPYRVDDGWGQSWERMGADEDERRFTSAQCVLIGVIVVSLAALLAFGIFWVGLRSSDRSTRDRIGGQPPAVNQEAQPADQKIPPEESPDQDTQPDDGTADIIILN